MSILNNENARYAYSYLKQKYGYTDAQAAGIVGNLMQESTFNTGARNKGDGRDGSDSIGIGQWNGDRAINLHGYAKATGRDVSSLDTQLDFIHHELGGAEKRAGDMLRSASTPEQAARAMIAYERPQGFSWKRPEGGHGWDNRLTHAVSAANGWGGQNYDLAQMKAQSQPLTGAPNVSSQPTETAAVTPPVEDKRPQFIKDIDNSWTGFKGKLGIEGKGADTTFLGMKLGGDNGLAKVLGGAATSLTGGDDPIQAGPLPVAGQKASAEPIQVGLKQPSYSIGQSSDPEIELEKLKQRMNKRGGLGGLGGMYLG
ncbi:phage tail tip lysozyme [Agrobacterium tumefaciens]|uniref:phage tail tip lysozyme n=1 Tax=Agrobacterium tumefaciens TaxID=358 RepID=UPI0015740EB5|nr:phage tail tip lysozyme [Agrobacterium tumefaciens]WCJ63815.1 phage tail tip lysozyme [Agrobacterium tumefaciens]